MKQPASWRLPAVILILAASLVISLPTLRVGRVSGFLEPYFGRMSLGLDLAGGTDRTYRVRLLKTDAHDEKSLRDVRHTIQDRLTERIDEVGLLQARITPQGTDQLRVQIPVQDPEREARLRAILEAQHLLSFHAVVDEAESGASLDAVEAGTIVVPGARSIFLLREEPEIAGDLLAHAEVVRDELNHPLIQFTWKDEGAERFGEISQRMVGQRLAIVLAGVVQSVPVVQGRIGRTGVIQGDFSEEEARRMVDVLHMGSFPATLEPVGETKVGPTLGRDSAVAAVHAGLAGSFLVFGFLILRYRLSGAIATATLIANFLLQIVLLVAFEATLTLPGIAGFALTVGVSVDANILIFERIREELAAGRTATHAIAAGYDKAWRAILDSHVTTVTTGAILYGLGSGPIRGFAVTLVIGLFVNLFTAVWMTRVLQDHVVFRRSEVGLSI